MRRVNAKQQRRRRALAETQWRFLSTAELSLRPLLPPESGRTVDVLTKRPVRSCAVNRGVAAEDTLRELEEELSHTPRDAAPEVTDPDMLRRAAECARDEVDALLARHMEMQVRQAHERGLLAVEHEHRRSGQLFADSGPAEAGTPSVGTPDDKSRSSRPSTLVQAGRRAASPLDRVVKMRSPSPPPQRKPQVKDLLLKLPKYEEEEDLSSDDDDVEQSRKQSDDAQLHDDALESGRCKSPIVVWRPAASVHLSPLTCVPKPSGFRWGIKATGVDKLAMRKVTRQHVSVGSPPVPSKRSTEKELEADEEAERIVTAVTARQRARMRHQPKVYINAKHLKPHQWVDSGFNYRPPTSPRKVRFGKWYTAAEDWKVEPLPETTGWEDESQRESSDEEDAAPLLAGIVNFEDLAQREMECKEELLRRPIAAKYKECAGRAAAALRALATLTLAAAEQVHQAVRRRRPALPAEPETGSQEAAPAVRRPPRRGACTEGMARGGGADAASHDRSVPARSACFRPPRRA